jgi:hypothetical protein
MNCQYIHGGRRCGRTALDTRALKFTVPGHEKGEVIRYVCNHHLHPEYDTEWTDLRGLEPIVINTYTGKEVK